MAENKYNFVFPSNDSSVVVSASANWSNRRCSNLKEGGVWSSGFHPPQWVEIDLGENFSISVVRLTVDQSPSPASTVHHIKAGSDVDNLETVKTLKGVTSHRQVLTVDFSPIVARYIRIQTSDSPSWVGWGPIQIGTIKSAAKSARK